MKTICKHKFQGDLKLEYVKWDVKTLFIGTYNPGCCSELENSANWFYGRTQKNMFWNTLGFIYANNPTLGDNGNRETWLSFCKEYKIAVTDLIYEIVGLDLKNGRDMQNLCKGFSDSKLENYISQKQVVSTQVEFLIRDKPQLKELRYAYLTRRGTKTPWDNLWNPIKEICEKNNIYTNTLITPGGYNRFQFNNENFQRTPENLADIWINRNGFKICK